MIDKYVPKLFIGIGLHDHFYTLCETALKAVPGEGPMGNAVVNGVYQGTFVVTSHHLCNLSQDPTEAYAKAVEYSKEMNLKLLTAAGDHDSILKEITRLTVEEREERERTERAAREKFQAERDRLRAEHERRLEEQHLADVAEGKVPQCFRKFAGTSISDLPVDYVEYLRRTLDANTRLGAAMIAAFETASIARLPVADPNKYFGEVGAKIERTATCTFSYHMNSYYGPTMITNLVDDEGYLFVVMSGAFGAQVGEVVTFKAKIKDHSKYKEQAQTKLSHVKVVDRKS